MYFLRLLCSAEQVDRISGELWDAGTVGVREIEQGVSVLLIAAFETNERRAELLAGFNNCAPQWEHVPDSDWIQYTKDAWPARAIGERIFLATPWSDSPTSPGRIRIVHNPGIACGTGEHPCSRLALVALEKYVHKGDTVADVGTGSGILAIAALRLGASFAAAADIDEAALQAAKHNFELNQIPPVLVCGSSDTLAAERADVAVANINPNILQILVPDLRRITRKGGRLILTGFEEREADPFLQLFPEADISAEAEWRCIAVRI